MPLSQVLVGASTNADGTTPTARGGKTGEAIITELHGRFYEQNSRGALFSGGIGLTSISNATYTTGTLSASCTPIIGVWNPSTAIVNLVILQATLGVTMTALQATGGGPYVWASSVGNTAISTGNTPLNRKTLVAAGSSAKDMSNVALTGLTNALTVKFGSALGGGSAASTAFLATQAGAQTQQASSSENIDGAIIVPPGGVLVLLATATPVGHSAVSSIFWEEVAV